MKCSASPLNKICFYIRLWWLTRDYFVLWASNQHSGAGLKLCEKIVIAAQDLDINCKNYSMMREMNNREIEIMLVSRYSLQNLDGSRSKANSVVACISLGSHLLVFSQMYSRF